MYRRPAVSRSDFKDKEDEQPPSKPGLERCFFTRFELNDFQFVADLHVPGARAIRDENGFFQHAAFPLRPAELGTAA
jgi:hypothetical protein